MNLGKLHGLRKRLFIGECRGMVGTAFQEFFEKIMIMSYPNFLAISSGGGDWKSDGLLRHEDTVFAVYSPEQVKKSRNAETLKKIKDDYLGAEKHWPDMKKWTFVYNYDKWPPGIDELVKNLTNSIDIELWDQDRLWQLCCKKYANLQWIELLGPDAGSTEVDRRHYQNIFCELTDVMEKDDIRSAEWFRKNGLKWIDIEEKFVDERADIVELLRSKIEDKPIVLLNAKSGAGKTSIGFLLGHHLKQNENWRNVYYIDMKQNQDVRKSDLVSFVTDLSKESKSIDGSASMNLVIVDNAHLAPRIVGNIAGTSKKWRDYVRILIIVRTSEDPKMSLQMDPYVLEEDSQKLMETSNEKWSRIIRGELSSEMHLGIVNLGKAEFQKTVKSILLEFMKNRGLTASEGTEKLVDILKIKCGDSLRILSFILRLLVSKSTLVVKSEIQVQQVQQVDICEMVNDYYENLKLEISESFKADSLLYDIENTFDKTLAILSLLNTMEIPCDSAFIPILTNIAFPGSGVSAEAISKVVNHAQLGGDLIKHKYSTAAKIHSLYSLPHRSEASYIYKCRSNLKPIKEEDHRRIEKVLIKLLELCRDNALPVPMLQIMLFPNNIGLRLYDFPRYLNEDAPELARLAIEQEGEITSIALFNLDIRSYALGVEIAKAIRNMNEPWEGLQILWQRYNYAPRPNESNPVLDAIIDIENAIIDSILNGRSPWKVIREIDGIEPLINETRVKSAIKAISGKISKDILNDEEVLPCISNVLYLLDNEEMVKSVAKAIPGFEAIMEVSEHFICRFFKYDSYRRSREIRKSIQEILPKIIERMNSSKYPSYIIGELQCIEELLAKSDRDAIITCVASLAEELQDPSSAIVLGKISWNIELVMHDKIIDALINKLENDPNDLLLISVISRTSILAEHSKIANAVVRAMTESFYSDAFIQEVWRNNSWAEDNQFIKAAKTKVSEIARTMRTHLNPRIFLLNLPNFIFEEYEMKEVINNPTILSRIMTPVDPGLGVPIPFSEKVVEILESILSAKNKEIYTRQLADGKIW